MALSNSLFFRAPSHDPTAILHDSTTPRLHDSTAILSASAKEIYGHIAAVITSALYPAARIDGSGEKPATVGETTELAQAYALEAGTPRTFAPEPVVNGIWTATNGWIYLRISGRLSDADFEKYASQVAESFAS